MPEANLVGVNDPSQAVTVHVQAEMLVQPKQYESIHLTFGLTVPLMGDVTQQEVKEVRDFLWTQVAESLEAGSAVLGKSYQVARKEVVGGQEAQNPRGSGPRT